MTETQQSNEQKKVAMFIITIAILGTILALAWYFGMELPSQQIAALNPPENTISPFVKGLFN